MPKVSEASQGCILLSQEKMRSPLRNKLRQGQADLAIRGDSQQQRVEDHRRVQFSSSSA